MDDGKKSIIRSFMISDLHQMYGEEAKCIQKFDWEGERRESRGKRKNR
jgi:hypothetical protein